jgi:nitroimidazol reductase NimA-like FMN-containing flavoprotein (pyridoxamine 5'-phosphate oxidase superfamily)
MWPRTWAPAFTGQYFGRESRTMFRGMRRKRQDLSETETIAMLQSCSSGVLAVHGDDDYPYAVPLSFAYEDGKLFFHSAKAGHKIDALERNDKASYCVIDADDVVPSTFTTHFRSAIVFGKARVVTDDSEKRHALECLVKKYSPDYLEAADAEIDGDWKRVCVIELTIEHMTGKASIELVKDRTKTP